MLERYSRQLLVPGFELEGQDLLSAARVVIVGCGGLGVPVAMYLAAAGVGSVTLVDHDVIEWSNLPRQVAYSEVDIGRPKAEVLADRLRSMNSSIRVDAKVARLVPQFASEFLSGATVVVDATDNREARLLIDRVTHELAVPWVMGAAVQLSGQNIVFSARRREGCYHCLSPESIEGGGSCRELGILGPVVGAVALTQALDVIKCLTQCAPIPWGVLRICDFRMEERYSLPLTRRPDCPNCGGV